MQNTYKGQTAGGILKTAQVVEMQAGNWEIEVKDRDGVGLLAYIGDRPGFGGELISDVLVLCSFDGIVARLSMSDRAYNKMRELEEERVF